MKKKVLTGLLASVLLLSSVAAAVIGVNHFNNDPSTEDFIVQNKQYQSAIGGNVLDITDKDYVNIDDSSFDVSTLVATDDLGRNLSTDGTGDNGRQVAVFYNLNFDGLGTTQIFQDLLDANKPLSSGSMYWWGKPIFGYYLSSDTWVMRKHIEMFTLADVDYLVFDTTNDKAFTTQALKLMHLLHEYNEMGWDAPKVAFYTNTESAIRMLSIYSDIYSQNKYPDTWYMVDGKPLIIGKGASSVIKEFFTVRTSQWPNTPLVEGGYPWISFDDVATVQYDENGKHGVIPVSVAQNSSPNAQFSDNVLYGMTGATGGCRGRSWHDGDDNITEDSYKYGYNFQEEWDTAIASDAETAMILQWNEWRAGAYGNPPKVFDEMTNEYSRDIEPMVGGHFDNYYMQMVENIRNFKNTGAKTNTTETKTIDVAGDFSQWSSVTTTYRDMANGGIRRDELGFGDYRYVNLTGRNEMIYSKVAKDSEKLYFYVQTDGDISENTDGTWMNLYLDTDGDLLNNWNGYDFRVNGIASEGKLRLQSFDGSAWNDAAEVSYRVYGNQLMLEVTKAELGISGETYSVNFKWADSHEELNTFEDFYQKGDVMPYGRFNFAFNAK